MEEFDPIKIDDPVLLARALTIGYKRRKLPSIQVLHEIELEARRGELICVLGPNGAGKSTLLRTLTGVQALLGGEVRLLGDPVHHLPPRERARRVGVVLTERGAVGHLRVASLVALGRYPHTDWRGRLRKTDREHIRRALKVMGIEAFAHRHVDTLSDGERQKVMIARALAQDPALLVLDEPTAHLDVPNRVDLMQTLRDLAHTMRRTVLTATHQLDLALQVADQIWLVHEGRVEVGIPEALALSGRLAEVFQRDRIRFDPTTGNFKLNAKHGATIALESTDAIDEFWTRRALERLGYSVTDDAEPVIEVCSGPERTWILRGSGAEQRFDRLEALVASLRRGQRS